MARAASDASGSPTWALSPQFAVAAMFAAFGLAVGLFSGATGAILARAQVGSAIFGVMLTLNVATYLAAMSSGWLLARQFTAKRILVACAPLMGLVIAAMLAFPSATTLFAGLGVNGALGGLVDLTMNAEGTKLERQLGRPVLAGLHGAASAGLALGAIAGSLLADGPAPWIAPLAAFGAMAVASLAVAFLVPDAGLEHAAPDAPKSPSHYSRPMIVIGLAVGACVACETNAMIWSTPLLRQDAPTLAAISGLGGAFFAACQAAMRLNADRLRRTVGDRTLMIASMGVATLGFVVVASHFNFPLTVLGFAVIGVGTGVVVPCGFAMAVAQPGVTPSAALSATALFGSAVRLPAPLAVGALASLLSLSGAFSLFAFILAAAIIALAAFIEAPARRT